MSNMLKLDILQASKSKSGLTIANEPMGPPTSLLF